MWPQRLKSIGLRSATGPLHPIRFPWKLIIQVLMCYAAEIWWSLITHKPHAYLQLQRNIIKHIRQDVSRQSFQKFPVRRPRQPLW
jgi:hypothetical protein